ncbi:MAG: hypothetical protein HPY54_03945 [Chthonomonadetes bacterium]|nr:hypothetical protein [Chthonomonadetes bacterium]
MQYNESGMERDYLQQPLEPDPVIEAYKQGIDRSLLRANLRLSPAERLRRLEELLQFAQKLREAGKRLRGE